MLLTKKIILLLLLLSIQIVAKQNPAMVPIISYILSGNECSPVVQDSLSIQNPQNNTGNIPMGYETVRQITTHFKMGRNNDPSVIKKELDMPTQDVWDSWSYPKQALYVLNRERYDRNLKPYEGLNPQIMTISQDYAQLLFDTNTLGHNEDGAPHERINSDTRIADNSENYLTLESLALYHNENAFVGNPILKAIYDWMYNDAGVGWGHRQSCLMTSKREDGTSRISDNSGKPYVEGLVGFGLAQGIGYSGYGTPQEYYTNMIVMNVFDPTQNWNHSDTTRVPLCPNKP